MYGTTAGAGVKHGYPSSTSVPRRELRSAPGHPRRRRRAMDRRSNPADGRDVAKAWGANGWAGWTDTPRTMVPTPPGREPSVAAPAVMIKSAGVRSAMRDGHDRVPVSLTGWQTGRKRSAAFRCLSVCGPDMEWIPPRDPASSDGRSHQLFERGAAALSAILRGSGACERLMLVRITYTRTAPT